MKPPTVKHGPWKPAGISSSATAIENDPIRRFLRSGGKVAGVLADAYAGVTLIEFVVFLVRVVCGGVYLAARVVFHLLTCHF